MGKRYLLAFALPGIVGFGVYAAILLTDGTEDLSPIRFGLAFLALAVIWLGGSYVLNTRMSEPATGKGPDCDRCGEPTGKPFLYNMPRTHWRCEPCEQKVTDILFSAASNGTLSEAMLRYTRPTDRITE